MNNSQKTLKAIIKVASDKRPSSVEPKEVNRILDLPENDFVQSLEELKNQGYLKLVYGSNLITDISITTKVPTK
ncbi:hypothetical protein QMG96_05890 [Lactiplantibacillus plantarum]|uniref:hypothetical protein n=1 Tax=Lactiplantibacillus plantarum TaxID=1590 RepID=UPI0007B554E7|nr:hypothetical protein [Lactiplantibacillus plantarum]QLK66735.1 hypothetical protein LACP0422_15260 [Lactiplantibacillus plantarum]WKE63358.1 hypothetical protein QMG96_05890 [Lactiplantibacillus plantarum]WOD60541.1 hypothetical protein NXS20_05855 [Lactiplantibacillus plantarum]WQH17756.1 hypothetical protein T1I15_10225 [Lactiplantibacillus plantarum]